jgi:hypothetical protein
LEERVRAPCTPVAQHAEAEDRELVVVELVLGVKQRRRQIGVQKRGVPAQSGSQEIGPPAGLVHVGPVPCRDVHGTKLVEERRRGGGIVRVVVLELGIQQDLLRKVKPALRGGFHRGLFLVRGEGR